MKSVRCYLRKEFNSLASCQRYYFRRTAPQISSYIKYCPLQRACSSGRSDAFAAEIYRNRKLIAREREQALFALWLTFEFKPGISTHTRHLYRHALEHQSDCEWNLQAPRYLPNVERVAFFLLFFFNEKNVCPKVFINDSRPLRSLPVSTPEQRENRPRIVFGKSIVTKLCQRNFAEHSTYVYNFFFRDERTGQTVFSIKREREAETNGERARGLKKKTLGRVTARRGVWQPATRRARASLEKGPTSRGRSPTQPIATIHRCTARINDTRVTRSRGWELTHLERRRTARWRNRSLARSRGRSVGHWADGVYSVRRPRYNR